MDRADIIFDFECRFANLLDNFLDFERHLFDESLAELSRQNRSLRKSLLFIRHPDRMLSNILTTCREYLDVSNQKIDLCFNESSSSFAELTSLQYDENFGYRLMETLRNFVQHEAFGVFGVTHSGRSLEKDDHSTQSISYYISREKLLSSAKLKQNSIARKELNEMSDNVSLIPVLRQYIDCISTIHGDARVQFEEIFETDWTLIKHTISETVSRFGSMIVNDGFALYHGESEILCREGQGYF